MGIKKNILTVKLGDLELLNPIIAASGTAGYGEELSEFLDLSKIGAIVTKTITVKPREGNPTPRVIETPSGMINSIGLENKGLKDFVENKSKVLSKLKTKIIASIAGEKIDEFLKMAEEISAVKCVSAIEINLSCPNVKHSQHNLKCKLIAQDKEITGEIISKIKKKTKLPIIAKLSPNVTDIKEIALSAEGAGADALSCINTLFGVSVNADTRRPNIAKIVGGLSGPAIKPVALYFVREVYSACRIPIIGIGGIMTANDLIEFMLCGATAVQVGTGNFINPSICEEIFKGLKTYLEKNKIDDIMSLIGSLKI